MKLSIKGLQNFTLNDIACKDADRTLVLSVPLLEHALRIQSFRNWYRRAMVVNSWFRTEAHNATVPNAQKNSKHLLGIATDIAWPAEYYTFTPARRDSFEKNIIQKWGELCNKAGLRGAVLFYETFFHLDSRPGEESIFVYDFRR